MGYFIILVWLIICSLIMLYLFVIFWFFPKKTMYIYKKAKDKDSKYLPFIPKKFLDLIFLNNNEPITIWYSRIMSTIGLVLSCLCVYILIFCKN